MSVLMTTTEYSANSGQLYLVKGIQVIKKGQQENKCNVTECRPGSKEVSHARKLVM